MFQSYPVAVVLRERYWQIFYAVLVVRNVETRCPVEIFCRNVLGCNLQFHTLVAHFSLVAVDLGESCLARYGGGKQQVVCVLIVIVELERKASIEERAFDTNVPLACSFPFQVGVGEL